VSDWLLQHDQPLWVCFPRDQRRAEPFERIPASEKEQLEAFCQLSTTRLEAAILSAGARLGIRVALSCGRGILAYFMFGSSFQLTQGRARQ